VFGGPIDHEEDGGRRCARGDEQLARLSRASASSLIEKKESS
jgi:hypothetical protein